MCEIEGLSVRYGVATVSLIPLGLTLASPRGRAPLLAFDFILIRVETAGIFGCEDIARRGELGHCQVWKAVAAAVEAMFEVEARWWG